MARAKKKNAKKEETETEEGKHKEWHYIVGALIVLAVLYLILALLFNNLGKIDYNGLTFVKEKLGELEVYHYTYYFHNTQGVLIKYNLYLRTDPRKLNVPVEAEVYLPKKNEVYISLNATESLYKCENSNLAVSSLAAFLTNNDYKVKGATPDENLAKETNISYITCKNRPSASVILVQEGNMTSIIKKDNCYIIDVANCEILEAIEKFETQMIIDAKDRMKEEGITKTS
jgi:hypothetical protein